MVKFGNDKLRIGPTGTKKQLFKMPGKNGKLRNGKKWELPEYFTDMGLNAYEFAGGRMANFNDSEKYQKFRENLKQYDLAISLHAPYYISLTSPKEETYERSKGRIAESYAWATYLDAKRIVIHPGSYHGLKAKEPTNLMDFMGSRKKSTSFEEGVKCLLKKIIEGFKAGIERSYEQYPTIKNKFKNICVCPETMGKVGQIGTVKEIIYICKELGTDIARPCIDFGHIYARNRGKIPERKMYEDVFKAIEEELGTDVLKYLHIHYSHIAFTEKGEEKHVPNSDKTWGPDIQPLFEIIKEQNLNPIIINESPELETDAKLLMTEWKKVLIK